MGNLPNNLFKRYLQLKESYYEISISAQKLFGGTKVENLDACREFICEHLTRGHKSEVMNIPWIENFNHSHKHVHVVTLYLLGLIFQNCVSEHIRRDLRQFIADLDWYDYRYSWFLTCLYHDIASNIELATIPPNPSEQQKQLLYYLGDNDINYTIFNYKRFQHAYTARFSESLVQNYFYYRSSCGECDHGILGGYFLFDRLYKNFQNNTMDGRSTDVLYRVSSHLDHFAYICDSIICHNIWTIQTFDVLENETAQNAKEVEKYKRFGLSPLILKNRGERLRFTEHPLQFILCLADTIEPIKRFTEDDGRIIPGEREVLSAIDISLAANNSCLNDTCLKITWEDTVNGWCGFDKWTENIIKAKNWLAVSVEEKRSNNEISISFDKEE